MGVVHFAPLKLVIEIRLKTERIGGSEQRNP